MSYMGRNGRKIIWYSEKWESINYFEKVHMDNSMKVVTYAIFMFCCLSLIACKSWFK